MHNTKLILAYPPVDFSVPFADLPRHLVDIYFHYTNQVGRETCQASCAHCYFKTRPVFHIAPERALRITEALRRQGYNIGLAPADSFSDEALAVSDAETAGSAFRLASLGKSAWTAGGQLTGRDWRRRLDRAWALGYRSVIISAHEAAGTSVPIAGVTKKLIIDRAVQNLRRWNDDNAPQRFAISATFTIRKDNCTYENMLRMALWGVQNGIDVVRFNCFANFLKLPEHGQFEMSRNDIVTFFGLLRRLHEEFIDSALRFGISEDWGDAGIEQILPYLGPEWQGARTGWCRAGYRLFAMIEVDNRIVLTGCVDKWEPILGEVVEDGDEISIRWDHERIERLRLTLLRREAYACYGGVGHGREEEAGFGTSPEAQAAIFGSPFTRLTIRGRDLRP